MEKEYHILSLSGGKDSTALAFFMKENMPEIFEKLELVFSDTECDLPETYDYLNKIEIFLGKKILRIKPEASFEHLIQLQNFLPTPHRRWCTVMLKTLPFKNYIKNVITKNENSIIKLYIGIRADELHRAEYNKYSVNYIQEVYPFVDNLICKEDVHQILKNVGINLPDYYKWIDRSGCYFCFFKSKYSWLLLNKHHPELYQKASEMEQPRLNEGGFGWNIDFSLDDMIKPENKIEIIKQHSLKKIKNNKFIKPLYQII